jgi:hypothetical protein
VDKELLLEHLITKYKVLYNLMPRLSAVASTMMHGKETANLTAGMLKSAAATTEVFQATFRPRSEQSHKALWSSQLCRLKPMLIATLKALTVQWELRLRLPPVKRASMLQVIWEPRPITALQAQSLRPMIGIWMDQALALTLTQEILTVHAMLAAKLLEMLLLKEIGALRTTSVTLVEKLTTPKRTSSTE